MRELSEVSGMVRVELLKAVRSRLPLWTALGSLCFPLGITFLIFVARTPEVSRELGLVSAKANLMAYSATDWPAYLSLLSLVVAAGGFFLFVLVASWVFGREFVDGTLKDLLAVPVRRASILAAKFVVVALWSSALSAIILAVGLVTGAAIGLPGGSSDVLLQGATRVAVMAGLVVAVALPFALLASAGRGYLLPIGLAIAVVMLANGAVLVGRGEYFPWAVPGLYAQGQALLAPISYWLVGLTGLGGMLGTYLGWKLADQSR